MARDRGAALSGIKSHFTLFAGFYYRAPKWAGFMYKERAGQIHFGNSIIWFNVAFFPQHFLGLAGMPHRYADYPAPFTDWNMVSTTGAFGFGLSQAFFLLFVLLPAVCRKGEKAAAKPWEGAEGLEWTVPSPAPFHTSEVPPVVKLCACRSHRNPRHESSRMDIEAQLFAGPASARVGVCTAVRDVVRRRNRFRRAA
jgi:heme/copper-type cytochrome/quinol oxidase subunit 1